MGNFGRLVESRSNIPWVGCLDHRLQIITKIAFEDHDNEGLNTMKMARALVGAFCHSTQAMEALLLLQKTQVPGARAVHLIQDITTRWWSTFSMIKRLQQLKPFIEQAIVQLHVSPAYALSQTQWAIIEKMEVLLYPFKFFQQLLEGESYVTISFVPVALLQLKEGLQKIIDDASIAQGVVTLAKLMMEKYCDEFIPDDGTMFYNSYQEVRTGRRVGVSREALIACALDPRTKSLKGIPNDGSHEEIWKEIETRCMRITDRAVPEVTAHGPNAVVAVQSQRNHKSTECWDELADFLEDEHDVDNDNINNAAALSAEEKKRIAIRLEIDHYKSEKKMSLFKIVDGERFFNDPLSWWRDHESRYPHLASLSPRILCIPATSAPSERLFSSAGLTIANDRANVMPHHAESVIFLKKIGTYLG